MSDLWNRGARKRWLRPLGRDHPFSACLFVESPIVGISSLRIRESQLLLAVLEGSAVP